MEKSLLPSIPAKRYFTIGEVSDLCGVKPHVLRYWEQEFTQLRPMKRRGNRRYYQHHEVLMIRRIRDLLYDQGFTISGARNKLQELVQVDRDKRRSDEDELGLNANGVSTNGVSEPFDMPAAIEANKSILVFQPSNESVRILRQELTQIRDLLYESRP
jgi:DNA-binding transcriptional MerR regulator